MKNLTQERKLIRKEIKIATKEPKADVYSNTNLKQQEVGQEISEAVKKKI